jgi:hypothetical protein
LAVKNGAIDARDLRHDHVNDSVAQRREHLDEELDRQEELLTAATAR